MELPVIRRTEAHLSGPGGQRLFRRSWVPVEPRRLVLLVHGFAEHSGRYEDLGTWFAARGCAVHAYDQQGHGHSEGARGHVRRFTDLLDDLEAVLEQCRREHPGLPDFVVGHSMGGLVTAAFVRERQPRLCGAVSSAAALELREAVSAPRLLLMRVLARVAPRLRIAQPIPPESLSRDPAVGEAYVADPLVFSSVTLALGAGLFDAAQRTLAGAADVTLPMLILHGAEDRLCPATGSQRFYDQLTAPGCELRIYPELRHEIFNEPERETVFADVLEWLVKRETA